MSWGFIIGKVYNRRSDIHARFAGQQQGGIITPRETSFPIIIITGAAGAAHGYADRERPDGVFEYFGEGQQGNMAFRAGNAAIQKHSENGRDLLLFQKHDSGLIFRGQFVFENYRIEQAPDTAGQMRDAIVFELLPLEAVDPSQDYAPPALVSDRSLEELRALAFGAASSTPMKGERLATVFQRSRIICSYIYARATGLCECCGAPAPFLRADGCPISRSSSHKTAH